MYQSKFQKFFTAKNASSFRDNAKTIIYALIFALIFRSFAFEPFHIPSGSMKSNLLVGDYLFVSKFSYGYSRYSFPYWFKLMPFDGRMFEQQPERGDIVVFHPPGIEPLGDQFIKRLIGLPGDKIQMKEGILYINDKPVKREYVDEWQDKNMDRKGEYPILKRYKETLPEGKSYYILNNQQLSDAENTEVYTVPEKHYFMMGDNRDNSRDSRFANPVGFVPFENLIGRADIIFFSWACDGICRDRFLVNLN